MIWNNKSAIFWLKKIISIYLTSGKIFGHGSNFELVVVCVSKQKTKVFKRGSDE
jgi:hypothetical protein